MVDTNLEPRTNPETVDEHLHSSTLGKGQILDLPNELLTKILGFLPENTRQNCRLISSRFDGVYRSSKALRFKRISQVEFYEEKLVEPEVIAELITLFKERLLSCFQLQITLSSFQDWNLDDLLAVVRPSKLYINYPLNEEKEDDPEIEQKCILHLENQRNLKRVCPFLVVVIHSLLRRTSQARVNDLQKDTTLNANLMSSRAVLAPRLSRISLYLLETLFLFAPIYAQNCPNYPAYLTVGPIEQFFHTPGYPEEYPDNYDCSLSLNAADSNARIHVTVYDSEFEDRLFSECPDYMSIKDDSQSSEELVKWCGKENPINVAGGDDSMYITFHSDVSIKRRGVNLSFIEFKVPGCPPGWSQPKNPDSAIQCYKIIDLTNTQKGNPTWLEAQRLCSYEKGDLFTADSDQELATVVGLLSHRNQVPWVGYHDANAEGNFQSIDGKQKKSVEVRENEAERDCAVLDANGGKDGEEKIHLVARDCRERHPALCKRLYSGDQVSHSIEREKIRKGYASNSSDWTIWAIFILALILLLLLIYFFYKQLRKRCCGQNHVGPIEATTKPINSSNSVEVKGVTRPDDQSASRMTTPHPGTSHVPSPTIKQPDSNLIIVKEKTPSTLPLPPLIDRELPQEREPEKARLASSPSPREEKEEKAPDKETHVKINDDLEKKAEEARLQPRKDLPPLPTRETTYLSLKEPERSFLKTHRDGGLFDRPKMKVLDNVSAISLDEFWNNSK
ncbi:unnamed protein product, partial [Mesorhabditis belari]|uniref:Uncharacterized protein n=1 Tax=Mesorhabditis belari TaxID=2138241 RepID=A0AAF3EGN7_9BILA